MEIAETAAARKGLGTQLYWGLGHLPYSVQVGFLRMWFQCLENGYLGTHPLFSEVSQLFSTFYYLPHGCDVGHADHT